jgi:sugar lactone lactonase YvrE
MLHQFMRSKFVHAQNNNSVQPKTSILLTTFVVVINCINTPLTFSQSGELVAGGGVGDGLPALQASLVSPDSVFLNDDGTIYITDSGNHRIRKVDPATGIISTIAGNGVPGYSGDGGQASAALLDSPEGLILSGDELYFTELGNAVIRKINLTSGIISTAAGTGERGYNGDGIPATEAQLNHPDDIALDSNGNLYIADTSNYRIRKVDAVTGVISTIAGTGKSGDDESGINALTTSFGFIHGIYADSKNNLFVLDQTYHNIRVIYAGEDGNYSTTEVLFDAEEINGEVQGGLDFAEDIYIGIDDNLYVLNTHANEILKITKENLYILVNQEMDEDSSEFTSVLDNPNGLFVDQNENFFIADTGNNVIRKINTSDIEGETTSEIIVGGGVGDGDAATNARLDFPQHSQLHNGTLYIADTLHHRIRAVDLTTGIITTVAGNGKPGFSGDSGPATAAALNFPVDIALDDIGNLFIVDSENFRIRHVDASTGIISTYAGEDGSGSLAYPTAITFDSDGNLYIADTEQHQIKRIDRSTGMMSTFAGTGEGGYSGDGGAATEAQLYYPNDVSFDSAGNLYIADLENYAIRVVDTQGTITTFAGTPETSGYSGDGEDANNATFESPVSVDTDADGNVFVTDFFSQAVRMIEHDTHIIYTIARYNPDAVNENQIVVPVDVNPDNAGNIYVTDHSGRILKLATVPLARIGQWSLY